MATPPPLKVMIVGAGIGGLMLAILLQKQNVDYEIYERALTVKHFGSAMSLGPNVLPVFEQLGLLEELKNISHPCFNLDIYTEDSNRIVSMDIGSREGDMDYDLYVFGRPEFHELLLSKVPKEKIHFGKRVLSVGQSDHGAMIRCADGTTYDGDILIGADGAYSAVRQSLYERLAKDGKLPKSDTLNISADYTCMVGITEALDPEKYAVAKDDISHFAAVIAGGKPLSWTVISIPGQRFAWCAVVQLSAQQNNTTFRNSEWGPESIDPVIAMFADLPVPYGGTMGDLINSTPKELISNVYLEEKIFETWSHGRIALLGDEDAVIIANGIYDMTANSQEEIKALFQVYRAQRYSHAKMQVENSAVAGKLFFGQTLVENIVRKIILSYMPKWFEKSKLTKAAGYRPQATFLPLSPKRGTLTVTPQKMSKRYRKEQAAKGKQDEATGENLRK
ncbi:hypothetical protein BGZ58_003596 [Dissophora ornata]|nr:hypothetical protein BGZ58_003596 [Dissophora ornata]